MPDGPANRLWRYSRILLAIGLVSFATADTPSPANAEDKPQRSGWRRGEHGRGKGRGPHSRPWRGPRGFGLTRGLFGLGPEDRGPLQPGETEELLEFAREHMPRLYEVMERLRARNPDALERKLADHAPRIRHLKRIFEHNPAIGQIIQQHAENEFRMRRLLRRWRRTTADAPLRAEIEQRLREHLTENVHLEIAALEARAAELETDQDVTVARRLERLLSEDLDLAAVPDKVRPLIRAYRAATDNAQREAAHAALAEAVQAFTATELAALHERVDAMRERLTEVVDERLQRALERAADGHRGRPRRRGRS